MRVDRVAIGAENAALSNLREDSLQRVATTLDHVGQMDQRTFAGTVLGSGIKVVELEGGGVEIVSALLASTLYLDAVSDSPSGLLICSHVCI
jgi:hypothetical protein